ncbi:dihydroorotase [Bacillus marinisedimentorum]|uniref:dihydroorotase n=1 Tax=Bacillus marinisedimentorum TaxID=1821260 RepID=UPI0007E1DB98|nr:dihydroorotase [Bacillus marinisedimentorum]
MDTILKNVNVLNEDGKLMKQDIRIASGRIEKIAETIEPSGSEEVKDAGGLFAAPGLVDLHVHLREPGGEKKETIASGTRAAALGGFTTIAAMPNTRPVPDHPDRLDWLNRRIQETAAVRVLPYASITVREAGKELTDFSALSEKGAFAFTDDGVGVQSAGMMLSAMKKAASLGKAIVAHCEDDTLKNNGAVHDGRFAEKHQLRGIPSVAESVHIARDVLLAEASGCHYHVCHISTKESVRVVRDAKRAGIRVTAEVTPHHLLLSEDDIPGLDSNFKMNPPLRSREDKEALLQGLKDGTIDFIATDHAPHTEAEKAEGMELAPFGITGLETAFPLLYTYLVETGEISLKELVEYLTVKPSGTFGLPYGTLEAGKPADIVLIDLDHEKVIDPERFASKGKNTPFGGWKCKGWPAVTYVNGKLVWEKGSVPE